jgi:hypothetical protein
VCPCCQRNSLCDLMQAGGDQLEEEVQHTVPLPACGWALPCAGCCGEGVGVNKEPCPDTTEEGKYTCVMTQHMASRTIHLAEGRPQFCVQGCAVCWTQHGVGICAFCLWRSQAVEVPYVGQHIAVKVGGLAPAQRGAAGDASAAGVQAVQGAGDSSCAGWEPHCGRCGWCAEAPPVVVWAGRTG